MNKEHSPLPWGLGDDGCICSNHKAPGLRVVAVVEGYFNEDPVAISNAALMVCAVNNHDKLVEALKDSYKLLEAVVSGNHYIITKDDFIKIAKAIAEAEKCGN